MEKYYIGYNGDGTYNISRYPREETQEFPCIKEDLSSFSKIPAGDMIAIQKKINSILYKSQLELGIDKN